MNALDNIRFVFVEPALPRNVGAAARVMKNFELFDMRIVNGKTRGKKSFELVT